LIDILHSIAVTAGTPNRGHSALIFPAEFRHAHGGINDGCIDQQFVTADRTAIEVLLWRWPEGDIQAFLRERLVALATHTSLS
jgi:hypothetical protein